MDVNEYFDAVDKKLEEMSDEEFMKLLEESGLEKCPLVEKKKDKFFEGYNPAWIGKYFKIK